MTDQEFQAIRSVRTDPVRTGWALAARLPGMREECRYKDATKSFTPGAGLTLEALREREQWHKMGRCGCRDGVKPIPLTTEGLIDLGRLIQAIEAEKDVNLSYLSGTWHVCVVFVRDCYSPDLAVAYLKAQGDWPPEEDAHA